MISLFRTGLLGSMFVITAAGVGWVSLSACASLSQTSPLPPDDASDLDAGQPPDEGDQSSSSGSTSGSASSSSGDLPTSARIRLANLLQGPDAVDLCIKNADQPTLPYFSHSISDPDTAYVTAVAVKSDGLAFGETSQSLSVNVDPKAGTKYTFKVTPVGTDCADATQPVYASIATPVTLRGGGGVTIIVSGISEKDVDAGDAIARATSVSDTLAPPPNASLLRVFHAVPDVAAFDVVINGETILTGVKYGSALGYPYTSPSGYASIAAGVPEDATLTLRSGTTVRSFTIPTRLRRGAATSIFVGGTKAKLTVELCSDRTPDKGDTASCTKLSAQE